MADTRPSYTNTKANEYNADAFGTKLRSQGYNIGTYSYPVGLGVYPDLQHYVTFFINVRSKSKFIKDGTYKTLKDQTSLIQGGSIRNGIDATDVGTAAVFGGSVLAGIAAGGKALGVLLGTSKGDKKNPGKTTSVNSTMKNLGTIAAKGVVAIAGAEIAGQLLGSTDILTKDKTERLVDVITLHMQEKPSVRYGINYQDKDLGILGGFLGDSSASDSVSPATMHGGLAMSAALKVAQIPSMLPGMGGVGNIADIVQLGAKVKSNPFREVFFEGIDYRTFTFKYRFMPKDKTEVSAVYNIIAKFKEHMHPELAAGGAFFLYPSEFEIKYYYNNKENGYYNSIATCALTDMGVEYGGDQLSSFSDGSPTEINLILSFRELELITKESIKNRGY
jgi:hypothetical protein